jgi:hypothetical protein
VNLGAERAGAEGFRRRKNRQSWEVRSIGATRQAARARQIGLQTLVSGLAQRSH